MWKNKQSVHQIAKMARMDADDVLITLWDNGFAEIKGQDDVIKSSDLGRAYDCLHIVGRREIKKPEYWMRLLGVKKPELLDILNEKGISMSLHSIRLPKNAISKLKSFARKRKVESGTFPPQIEQGEKPKIKLEIKEIKFRDFRFPGHEKVEMRWLAAAHAHGIHASLAMDVAKTDNPIEPPGCKSFPLLESALSHPQTSIGGSYKYLTVESSAAALFYALIQNHPFHNGNKRTALVSMLVFLDENDYTLECNEDELYMLSIKLAQHSLVEPGPFLADREVLRVTEWLCKRARPTQIANHPINILKLKRILSAFDCRFENKGNDLAILRQIKKGIFFKSSQDLISRIPHGREGRELDKKTVKKIREDLHLVQEHGVDSTTFYSKLHSKTSDFIVQYSKTLRRLANH